MERDLLARDFWQVGFNESRIGCERGYTGGRSQTDEFSPGRWEKGQSVIRPQDCGRRGIGLRHSG
jgi:hypothetical protein